MVEPNEFDQFEFDQSYDQNLFYPQEYVDTVQYYQPIESIHDQQFEQPVEYVQDQQFQQPVEYVQTQFDQNIQQTPQNENAEYIDTSSWTEQDFINYYAQVDFYNKYPNAFVYQGKIYNSDLDQYVPSKIGDLPNEPNLQIVKAPEFEEKSIKRNDFLKNN